MRYLVLALMVLTTLPVTGCIKAEPFEYKGWDKDSDQPGLLSGKEGEITIYRSRTRRR